MVVPVFIIQSYRKRGKYSLSFIRKMGKGHGQRVWAKEHGAWSKGHGA
jgi:hypothetical protein